MANTEGRDVVERLRAMASGEKAGELGEQEAAALLAVVEAAKAMYDHGGGVGSQDYDALKNYEAREKIGPLLARLYDGSSGDA